MRAIETTIYRCEHCNKLYLRPKWCIKHEIDCVKNPVNDRPCKHCINLCMKEADVDTGIMEYDGSPISRPKDLLYCDELEMHVYQPSIKHPYDTGEDNIPMPLVCGSFKERG